MTEPYFYTAVDQAKNGDLLVRGYQNGKRFMRKVQYRPYLFVPTKGESKYRTLDGKPVKRMDFESIKEAKTFIYDYKEVQNFEIFGQDKFAYSYINDEFYGEINFDPQLISVVGLDIETKTVSDDGKKGFPDIAKASHPITAITMKKFGGPTYMFGLKDYRPKDKTVTYFKCTDEASLLAAFIELWDGEEMTPDILTGWNIEFFDIPYLVNRITKILGPSMAKMLSPWRILEEYEVTARGRTQIAFRPVGVSCMDYLPLYKKFSFKNQESFTLEYIAQVELKEGKTDYSRYDGLDDMYDKDPALYYDYNLRDVLLIERLEAKLGFIAMVEAFAYDAKVNYGDTLATVKPWDVIISNFLLGRNIVVPQFRPKHQEKTIVGGYVKEPILGMSKWVVSFDLNSLYPSLIMAYNIGPDTFIEQLEEEDDLEMTNAKVVEIMNGKLNQRYQDALREDNVCITANMALYSKKKIGFMAELMQQKYDQRKIYQAKLKEAKKEYAKTKDPAQAILISRYHALQLSKKIQINAFYGSIANKYCRWFSLINAEAITTTGQLTIQWVQKDINKYLNKVLETEGLDFVIASDTDSAYITLDKFVEKFCQGMDDGAITDMLDKVCKTKLQDVINKSFEEQGVYTNAFDASKLVMKRESIASKGIWVAKKRYILYVWDNEGIRYEEPEIKITGLEVVKSSTPGVCKKAMKECFKLILTKPEDELHSYIDDFYSRFMELPFEEVASPRGISDMDKWVDPATIFKSGTPMHVKGAIMWNHTISKKGLDDRLPTLYNGDKIKYSYLKKPNPLNVNVISTPGNLPPELGLDSYIDRDIQFQKTFIDPMKLVTDVIGWTPQKTYTLDSFFS